MTELLPCPFCGSATAALEPPGADESYEYSVEVVCGSCQGYAWGETADAARATWNRRVPSPRTWQPIATAPGLRQVVLRYADGHLAIGNSLDGDFSDPYYYLGCTGLPVEWMDAT